MPDTVITAVKVTKKGRMALFSQEGFLFSLDELTYAQNPLAKGDALTEAELEQLKRQSDSRKAREKALYYLEMREHSARELYRKLCGKYDEETALWAVRQMADLGLLDDAQFARHKAAECKRLCKSRREAMAKLRMAGVDADIAEEALDEVYAPEDDYQQALRLLQRHYAGKLAAGKIENVMAALCRRGFRPGVAKQAIQDVLEENEQE